jgi:hypothetical protein
MADDPAGQLFEEVRLLVGRRRRQFLIPCAQRPPHLSTRAHQRGDLLIGRLEYSMRGGAHLVAWRSASRSTGPS